jgi:CDGSH-type Zn-finger protein
MSNPETPQKEPYGLEVKPGKYFWCACGKSTKQPYCDGSHKGTDIKPVMEEITEEKTVYWCGCKHTGNPPFCDGTHNKM